MLGAIELLYSSPNSTKIIMCQSTAESFDSETDGQHPLSRAASQDMKWQFTPQEKKAVLRLKQAADAEGLYYKNLLELFKYVLVVQSLESQEERRAAAAVERLRRRHEWMERMGLQDMDARAAHTALAQDPAIADHFVQRYQYDRKSGRAVVATNMASVPLSYIQQSETHYRQYLAAAMYRMDLGAVDLAEARHGMVLATISDDQLSFQRAVRYLRFVKRTAADMKDMHPHTVKAVHAEVPAWVAHLLPAVKHVLPRKVAERVHVYASLSAMDGALQPFKESSSSVAQDLSAEEWARRREEHYQETVAHLSLD